MKTWVLDASAVLRFTDKEAGFDRVRELLRRAARGEARVLISAVNWGEIVHAVRKRTGARAATLIDDLQVLPITIATVDAAAAAEAGEFKLRYGVPFADAFAGSLALQTQASDPSTVLITADNDFRQVPQGLIAIEFLPAK